MTEERKVVVLGSGPAGYTAALYAARANLGPLVLKGLEAGGQLMLTTDVENYPGFADGIMGPELMDAMEKQAARFDAEIVAQARPAWTCRRAVRRVVRRPGVAARTVIVATGASAKWLGVPGEERLRGRGVSACATCDGFFFRDREPRGRGRRRHRDGGGDLPHEVREQGHDRAPPRRVPRLEDHAGARALEPEGRGDLGHRRGGDRRRRRRHRRQAAERGDGRASRTSRPTACSWRSGTRRTPGLLEGQLELTDAGYVVVDEPTTSTSVPGVFAAGDVTDVIYRQAVTAAGQGCKAAIDAERFLEETAGCGRRVPAADGGGPEHDRRRTEERPTWR